MFLYYFRLFIESDLHPWIIKNNIQSDILHLFNHLLSFLQPNGGTPYQDGHGLVSIRMKPDAQGRFGFNVKVGPPVCDSTRVSVTGTLQGAVLTHQCVAVYRLATWDGTSRMS